MAGESGDMKHEGADQKIALFGGAFDPFHNGHVAAISHLLRDSRVARVLVVPSGDRPDKHGVSKALHRLEMVRLGVAESFAGEARVKVCDLQARGRVGYATIDLVEHLQSEEKMPLLFVIGQELVSDLPQWKDPERLREKVEYLVLQRPGTEGVAKLAGWRLHVASPFGIDGVSVSSTELRERIARGIPCEGLLPGSVLRYCQENKLYAAH